MSSVVPFASVAGEGEDAVSSNGLPSPTRAEEEKKTGENPIGKTLSVLVHKLRDIRDCAEHFVPMAERMRADSLTEVTEKITASVSLLKSENKRDKVAGLRRALEWMPRVERVAHANHGRVLTESLFIGMFSAFDAFTGDLLRALFWKKPELFNGLQRQVSVAAIVQCKTLEELKASLIEEEIDAFRRESYADQFARLETMFGLKLRAFPRLAEFVERSQRRNLLTHCDGIVTDQYVKACKTGGIESAEKVGTRLDISSGYLLDSLDLLTETGIKLGQTLWRKVLPDEMEAADESLNKEIYDRLRDENWKGALVFSTFAKEQRKLSTDAREKIFTVNHIIALKFGGDPDAASRLLAGLDWSGAALDFQVAKAVLEDRFKDACDLMLRMGKRGELIEETSYYTFPLFRAFRLQEDFRNTYEKIYGAPFEIRVQETVDEAKVQLQKSAEQTGNSAIAGLVPEPPVA
jgi:hypothetical protein